MTMTATQFIFCKPLTVGAIAPKPTKKVCKPSLKELVMAELKARTKGCKRTEVLLDIEDCILVDVYYHFEKATFKGDYYQPADEDSLDIFAITYRGVEIEVSSSEYNFIEETIRESEDED